MAEKMEMVEVEKTVKPSVSLYGFGMNSFFHAYELNPRTVVILLRREYRLPIDKALEQQKMGLRTSLDDCVATFEALPDGVKESEVAEDSALLADLIMNPKSVYFDATPHDKMWFYLYGGMLLEGPAVVQIIIIRWDMLQRLVEHFSKNKELLRISLRENVELKRKEPYPKPTSLLMPVPKVAKVKLGLNFGRDRLLDLMQQWPAYHYLHCSREEMFNGIRSSLLKLGKNGKGVYVKESNLPNAGLGLFVGRDIPKYSMITEYTGKLISHKDAVRIQRLGIEKTSHMRTLISMAWVIDGRYYPRDWKGEKPGPKGTTTIEGGVEVSEQGLLPRSPALLNELQIGAAQFANDPNDEKMYNVSCCNVISRESAFSIYDDANPNADPNDILPVFIALRDIKQHEELYFSYGTDYWQRRGLSK